MNKKNIIKVCIPSVGENLESEIDSRFGRCKYFVLVEIKNGTISNFKAVKNEGGMQSSGAGIAAAEQVSKLGADIVLIYDVGPKSKSILDQLGIEIIKDSGSIKEAIDRYINSIN
jgi:predicted Fe-Mo cluster-binding NifX family protein